ncbi:MAG: glycosyltransferase family 4 protein, partial [Sulfolobaceae archaeon]
KFGIKSQDVVILVVGRMDPIKSQDVVIKAVKNLDVKLLIVGNGSFTSKTLGHDKSSVWLRKLYNLSKELGIENKVVFTGYVEHETLQALYQRSNVVILPSKVEGFGLTICEAWTYGKPVVVSDGAGVSELVIEGGNGYTFKRGDHKDLEEKIKLAIKYGEKFEGLAKETVKKCSIDYASKELYNVLEEAKKEYTMI